MERNTHGRLHKIFLAVLVSDTRVDDCLIFAIEYANIVIEQT